MFGATHYDRYEFLLTLSDHVAHFGLEHHQSSDDRQGAETFTDSDHRRLGATLLPHEYAHSWNGKYRRPVGLATGDYATPYNDELLWVYEGLTNYLGAILAVRSGLQSIEDFHSDLAVTAAGLTARPGRTWRPLQDTADEAQLLYSARSDYDAWRRSAADIYDEGALLWLEIDVTLRQLTAGRRSLDDFLRDFAGPPGGPPAEKLYTFDEIVRSLDRLAPHDWRGLLQERLRAVTAVAPLGGLVGSGWRLAYRDAPTDLQRAAASVYELTDARFSLGLLLSESDGRAGTVVDVIPETPAARAGLVPGMTLVAVNGRRYTSGVLATAMERGGQPKSPLALLVERQDLFTTCRVEYDGGPRFPVLERDPDAPDLLALITAPLTGDRR
jgi:predicted metalloprotease with PDZ domain